MRVQHLAIALAATALGACAPAAAQQPSPGVAPVTSVVSAPAPQMYVRLSRSLTSRDELAAALMLFA